MEEALTSDLDRDFHVRGRTWWLGRNRKNVLVRVRGRTWWLGRGWDNVRSARGTPTAGPITLKLHWREAWLDGPDVNRDFHVRGRTWWLGRNRKTHT